MQRNFFKEISPEQLSFIYSALESNAISSKAQDKNDVEEAEVVLGPDEVSANLRARAMHLAKDPNAVEMIEIIFYGHKKKARREALHDKAMRTHVEKKTLERIFFFLCSLEQTLFRYSQDYLGFPVPGPTMM